MKNTIQVIGLCMYNVGLLIYAAVQMDQIKKAVNALISLNDINLNVYPTAKPFLVAIPCILALGTVLMSFIAWKLYDEFAWTIYKHISADLRMKRRYLTYQVCRANHAEMANRNPLTVRNRSTSPCSNSISSFSSDLQSSSSSSSSTPGTLNLV